MNTLILENIPEHLHLSLKEQAARHRRSVADEATAILVDGIKKERVRKWPEPRLMKEPITDKFIDWAKRERREAKDCDLPDPIKGNVLLTDEMIDRAKREGRE